MDKIDLHIHSINSFDSNIRINLAIKLARKIGLRGIAITDHNKFTKIKIKEKNLIFIDGSEILTKSGEILAYGIQDIIKPYQFLDETIDKVHE